MKLADTPEVFTINKATATVKWGNAQFTYNGTMQVPTYTVEPAAAVTGVTYAQTAPTVLPSVFEPTNAGSYTATLNYDTVNYTLTNASKDFTIGKRTVTVKADDFTITYGDPLPTYTFRISGLADGEKLTVSDYKVEKIVDSFIYKYPDNGAGVYDIKPTAVAVPSGSTTDLDTNYETPVYEWGVLTVDKADLKLKVTPEQKTVTYGTTVSINDFNVVPTGLVNGDNIGLAQGDVPYTLTFVPRDASETAPTKVGNYAVVVEPVGAATGNKVKNYNITTVNAQLTIEPDGEQADFSVAFASTVDYVYDGTEKEPDVTVTKKGKTEPLTLGTDYDVVYANNVNAGTAMVTVNFKGAYQHVAPRMLSFEIKPLPLVIAWTGDGVFPYSGTEHKPNVTVKSGTADLVPVTVSTVPSLTQPFELDYGSTYDYTNAGGHVAKLVMASQVTANGKNVAILRKNYSISGSETATVIIEPVQKDIVWTGNAAGRSEILYGMRRSIRS